MRSALGIRRIRDVDVSQVLHASEADIRTLRNRLRTWGVSSFRDYPLLLRALTHPSISNWAERILRLPKRSLGPNTLELLGDRVVGTSVAYRVLQWRKEKTLDIPLHRNRPTALVQSLVGNRGMAITASDTGLDQLVRWEKSRPPESQRDRLTSAGVDEVTGLLSNVQINALSSAYEAVAAAVYLDGGFDPAESFVHNTLLRNCEVIQNANEDATEHEEKLARELERVLGTSLSFVASRFRPGRSSLIPIKSFEKVQCEILDLESPEAQNYAHRLYYAGIALRPMSEVENDIQEKDLLFVASHFSVENARIAALTGALESLRGERKAGVAEKGSTTGPTTLRLREIIFGAGGLQVNARFKGDGAWGLDGDYLHIANLLQRVNAPGMAGLMDMHTADVRERLSSMHIQRNARRCEGESEGMESARLRYISKDGQSGGFPRPERAVGEAAVCTESIDKCLDIGMEIERSRGLTEGYRGLQSGVECGEKINEAITGALDEVRDSSIEERSLLMKSYHALGHNAMKLWGVQRSMSSVCQDRSEVIGECERRGSLGPRLQRVMMGAGLEEIGDLRAKKVFVGLGVCVEQVGIRTAVAWLSGAEARMQQR